MTEDNAYGKYQHIYRKKIRKLLESDDFQKVKKGILITWGPELSTKYLDTIQLLYDSEQKENWEFAIVIGNSPSGKKGTWEEEINLGTFPSNLSNSIGLEIMASNPEVFNDQIHKLAIANWGTIGIHSITVFR